MARGVLAAGLIGMLVLRAGAAGAPWQTLRLPAAAVQLNQAAEAAADPAEAARLYTQAIRACPSNYPALYGLGRALLAQEQAAGARKVFERLNTLFPDDPTILQALAAAVARLPEPRRADIAVGLAAAGQAARLDPASPEMQYLLSVLLHLNGDYPAAAAAARQAVALDAENPVDAETTARYQQQEIICTDALWVFSPLD